MRSLFFALLVSVTAARADENPSESEMFGNEPEKEKPAQVPETQAPRDDAILGATSPAQQNSSETAAEDPLKIGGQFYLRSFMATREKQPPSAWTLSLPSLVDGYFDARPNERVRGFLLARMKFDPSIDPNAPNLFSQLAGATNGSGTGAATATVAAKPDPGPSVSLDQLWMSFDTNHQIFWTVGRQHVKWAAGRFWTPTDFLHPVRKDPLAIFDLRTGTTMVRANVPLEDLSMNVSAVALLEGFSPANSIGQVGGAARAEIVLGPTEFALDAIAVRGRKPRLGADFSFGLGDFDFYGEVGVRQANEVTLYRKRANPISALGLFGQFESYVPTGTAVQATGGASYAVNYNDNDVLNFGAEYFWNDQLGYDDASIYPWLFLQNAFTPFYLGKQYGALFVSLPKPGDWDNTSFTLSTLGNLSDRSFITRLDYSLVFLTNMTLEIFGDVHYGEAGGEFRLGVNVPPQPLSNGTYSSAVVIAPPLYDAGIALRVKI